jgi:hydrogenase expression/formation protein HypE
VCELLGLDPLYVACEGRVVVVAAADEADAALAAMRALPLGANAVAIGEVHREDGGVGPLVTVRTAVGGTRVLPMIAGEQLPRIC